MSFISTDLHCHQNCVNHIDLEIKIFHLVMFLFKVCQYAGTHPNSQILFCTGHYYGLDTWTSSLMVFFISLSLLIGWQLSIWNCCKPFFLLLYNSQLVCFWWLALSIVVVFPQPFSGYCSFKGVYYKLVMPNCMPYPWKASIF